MKAALLTTCLLLCLCCLGCGGGVGDRPQTIPVLGRLVKNGTPVPQAQIEFVPEKGAASSATTDPEGNFELIYADGKPGALIGRHQVRITVGGMLMANAGGDTPPPRKAPPQPMRYVIPEQSVSEGMKPLELELPLKGQPG